MKPPGLRNLIFICLHTERLSEKFYRESYRQAGQAKVSGSGSTKGRNDGRRWDANGQNTFYRRTKPGDKKSRQEKRRVAGPESRHPLCILHAHNAEKRLWRQRQPSVWVNNTCKTCLSEYVGETQPALGVRAKKHQTRLRLSQAAKSAVLEHVQDQVEPHTIDWESLKTIDHERGTRERKVRESFLIFRWNQRSTGTQALREAVYGMLVWQNYCMIPTFPIETNGEGFT